jgi:hypothetical protein
MKGIKPMRRCIVVECPKPRDGCGVFCERHHKHFQRTGSAYHRGLTKAERMQHRKKIHALITALHHKKDAQTRQMLGEFWRVMRSLPSSVPALDQMGYHTPDMKANTILVWIMRYLFHPKINRQTSYQSRSATERRFAVQFLSVCMASHLAAEQITYKPSYVQTQVAQAINEILRPHTTLQSRSIAKRLYAAFEPIYRYFLEAHKKDILSTANGA